MNKIKNAKKYSILIVEDEAQVLKMLAEKTAKEGFEAMTARDGAEGLRIALNRHPDLILLDLIMPVMDGITMLKKLREDEWGSKVAVIILTNLNDDKAIADSLESGVYDYLVKTNWTLDSMIKRIKEKLNIIK